MSLRCYGAQPTPCACALKLDVRHVTPLYCFAVTTANDKQQEKQSTMKQEGSTQSVSAHPERSLRGDCTRSRSRLRGHDGGGRSRRHILLHVVLLFHLEKCVREGDVAHTIEPLVQCKLQKHGGGAVWVRQTMPATSNIAPSWRSGVSSPCTTVDPKDHASPRPGPTARLILPTHLRIDVEKHGHVDHLARAQTLLLEAETLDLVKISTHLVHICVRGKAISIGSVICRWRAPPGHPPYPIPIPAAAQRCRC